MGTWKGWKLCMNHKFANKILPWLWHRVLSVRLNFPCLGLMALVIAFLRNTMHFTHIEMYNVSEVLLALPVLYVFNRDEQLAKWGIIQIIVGFNVTSPQFEVILHLQSIYVFWLPHRRSKCSHRQKRNLWLCFLVFYSALSTCKEHYPQENPTTLKNLCELNHFQTSGAEIFCCAQWMKYSAGDLNWMFLECQKSWIIRSTQNAFQPAFSSASKIYW